MSCFDVNGFQNEIQHLYKRNIWKTVHRRSLISAIVLLCVYNKALRVRLIYTNNISAHYSISFINSVY